MKLIKIILIAIVQVLWLPGSIKNPYVKLGKRGA